MVKMVGRLPVNSQTTMHSHKLTHRGMAMVMLQRTLLDMPTIRHRLHQLLIIKDSKDINHTLDN